jgi:aminocarboxymuconate-semialdehyde decarboxylase
MHTHFAPVTPQAFNLLGNPMETALAAAELVFGDALARHPGMRVMLIHSGGTVPAVVGRWQWGYDTGRPGIGRC